MSDTIQRSWDTKPDYGLEFRTEVSGGNRSVHSLCLTPEWVVQFAHVSRDYNQVHNPSDTARAARGNKSAFVHGAGLLSFVSAFITDWAGSGATALNTGETSFGRPAAVGTRVFYRLNFTLVDATGKRARWKCDCTVTNEQNTRTYMTVVSAEFLMPPE